LHVLSKAYDSYTINWMQVYIDRKKVYTTRHSAIDTYLAVTGGMHRVTVTENNAGGQTYSTTRNVTVQ
jgi:hypothetical protein